MKGRRMLAALVSLAFLVAPLPSREALAEGDWNTRGGSPSRPQAADESYGPVAATLWWEATNIKAGDSGESTGIGATGSQPLFVGDRIYHLAGNALWEIDQEGRATKLHEGINMVPGSNGLLEVRPSTSGVTFAEVNGRGFLYYGTGDNRVCAYGMVGGKWRCLRISDLTRPEQRIVTVPLVLYANSIQQDIVIMGDKQGRLWAIQGLATATRNEDVISTFIEIGGWILASPVQVGPEADLTFVAGNDEGNSGVISAFRVIPKTANQPLKIETVWPRIVQAPAGIADGFAKGNGFVYASDTMGNFYRIDTEVKAVETFSYSASAGPMFVNAAPAFDDSHVYFSIRNVGTTTPSTTAPGRLVALNRNSFNLDGGWVADLPAPANTNPLVWTQGPNVVLVGDTKGTLHAFNRETGVTSAFAVQASGGTYQGRDICTPLNSLDLGAPEQAGQAYQTLTGISEPIIASGSTGQGLLLVGVSGQDKQGSLIGTLKAFKAGGSYNIAWTQPEQQAVTIAAGQPYEAKGELTMTTWGGVEARPRTVGLQAYWVPADDDLKAGAKVRLVQQLTDVTVDPARSIPVSIPFTPTEADGVAGSLRLFINPEQLMFAQTEPGAALRKAQSLSEQKPANHYQAADPQGLIEYIKGAHLPGNCAQAETELLPEGWDAATIDNVLTMPVTIEQAVDLSVHTLRSPGTVTCETGGSFSASFMINNPSGRTLKGVPYALKVTSGKTGIERIFKRGVIDLAPGNTPVSAKIGLMGCGETLSLRAEANLGPEPRPVKEPDFSNNAASSAVRVEDEVAPEINLSTGSGDLIIVPADCVANPDLTSRQPCLNYPNLIMP